MVKIYEYLKRNFKNIIFPLKNLWYSITRPFLINPLNEVYKSNFTKSLEDYITSKFNISYNSRGILLTKKINNQGLVAVLNN